MNCIANPNLPHGLMSNITLSFNNFRVYGSVLCEMWDGTTGGIEMTPFAIYCDEVVRRPLYDVVKDRLNDGGFGCARIIGAFVNIKSVYVNKNKGGYCELNYDQKYLHIIHKLTKEEQTLLYEIYCDSE